MSTNDLKLVCCRCGEPLKTKGALVISPPVSSIKFLGSDADTVLKYHVCITCWPLIIHVLLQSK